jgi:hypothetical protein
MAIGGISGDHWRAVWQGKMRAREGPSKDYASPDIGFNALPARITRTIQVIRTRATKTGRFWG